MTETGREQDMLYMEELERVTEERDRLREALNELATVAEKECKYDTVLRKSLSPYCVAARAALKDIDDGR